MLLGQKSVRDAILFPQLNRDNFFMCHFYGPGSVTLCPTLGTLNGSVE